MIFAGSVTDQTFFLEKNVDFFGLGTLRKMAVEEKLLGRSAKNFRRWGLSIHDDCVKISEGSIKLFRLQSRFSKVSRIAEIVIRGKKVDFSTISKNEKNK